MMSSHAQTPADRERRWGTYGLAEMRKEVEHLDKYLPGSEIAKHARTFMVYIEQENRTKYDGGKPEK